VTMREKLRHFGLKEPAGVDTPAAE
jgi:hypothetical protein